MDLNLPKSKIIKFQPVIEGSRYRNAVIELVLLIVVAGLFYWFLISPKKTELGQVRTQLSSLQSQRDQIESQVATLQNLSKQLTDHASDVDRLDEALPLQERQVRTQLLLNQLVSSSGVVVGDITVSAPNDAIVAGDLTALQDPYGAKRALGSVDVSVSVNGTLAQLLDMLHKLENYGRIMDVGSLTLNSGANGTLDLKLGLTTYYFSAQAAQAQ